MAGVQRCGSFRKWICVSGLLLIICPSSIMLYWANLSVYLNSYFVDRISPSSNVPSIWFLACSETGSCLGLLLSGFLNQRVGKRLTTVIATFQFLFGLIFSYFIVDVSGLAISIVAGLLTAIGLYNVIGAIMQYLLILEDGDYGLLYSVTQSGLTVGPIVVNQLITLWINPDNLSPDLRVGPYVFFSQSEVLDNVPSTFLIIAACVVICYVVGMLLVELNISDARFKTASKKDAQNCYGAMSEERMDGGVVAGNNPVTISLDDNQERGECEKQKEIRKQSGLSPLEAIRTREMYVFWLSAIFGTATYGVNFSFYKAYGQLYIDDDHFLTNVSLVILVGATLIRPMWGRLLDKFSIKTVFIIYFSSSGISSLYFYFSPMVNKWCYILMNLTFTSTGGTIYIIMVVVATKAFGEEYSVYNSGLIFIPSGVAILLTPFLFEILLENFGWFSLYASCAGWNLMALLMCVFALPEKKRLYTQRQQDTK